MADQTALQRSGAASAAPLVRRTLKRRSPAIRRAVPYLLVAPAVVYLLSITLYPGAFAIWQSFFVVRLTFASGFTSRCSPTAALSTAFIVASSRPIVFTETPSARRAVWYSCQRAGRIS